MHVRLVMGIMLGALLVSMAGQPAAAHTDIAVATSYLLNVGWRDEPPLVDAANALSVRVDRILASPDLLPGDNWSFMFPDPGVFDYHDESRWTQAAGSVRAGSQEGRPAQVAHVAIVEDPDGGARFEPRDVEIAAGDTVVWHNNASGTHTLFSGGLHNDNEIYRGPRVPQHGLAGAFEGTLEQNGTRRTFDFRAAREPGLYEALVVPTRAGEYTLQLHGSIDGTVFGDFTRLESVVREGSVSFPDREGFRARVEVDGPGGASDTAAATPVPFWLALVALGLAARSPGRPKH